MPIILNGTTGITTPGITNTGPFVFQGVVELPAGAVGAPSLTTTGDTNTGIYFPAADTIAFAEGGVEALRINSSAQIAVNTAGTAGAPVITKTDDLNTGIFFPAADTIAFSEGGVESMRIDASGNLGLGVTPSAWGGTGKAIQLTNGSSIAANGAIGINANAYYDGTNYRYIVSSTAAAYIQAGSHFWYQAPTGTAGNVISFTTAMTLDTSGNLGLGVTPSAWNSAYKSFDIASGGGGSLFAGAGFAGLYTNAFVSVAGQETYKANGFANQYIQVSGSHRWYNAPSGTAGNAITFTQAMTLDASGNLGIGTTSPATRLDVRNTASTTGSIFNLSNISSAAAGNIVPIRFFTGNTFGGLEQCAAIWGINPNAGTNNGGALVFATSDNGTATTPSERARITSAGDFLVGGTSVATSDASAPQINCISSTTSTGQWSSRIVGRNTGNNVASFLGVYRGASLSAPGVFAHSAALNAWATLYVNTIDGTGSGSNGSNVVMGGPVTIGTATPVSSVGTTALTIKHTAVAATFGVGPTSSFGNFYVVNSGGTGVFLQDGGTSWLTTSDERTKDIIEPITNAVSKVSSLRTVIGKFKKDGPDKRRPFLIAQDVEKVLPEVVDKSNADEWALSYTETIPLLVAAIKELKAELDALKGLH